MVRSMPKSCLCYSSKPYEDCCEPYHLGLEPPNALALMRSRYCGYAKCNVDYIQRTQTAPINKSETLAFCKNTQFTGLTIHSFQDGQEEAFVTFTAHLKQNGADASFKEKSRFLKIHGCWRYVSAE